MLWLLGIVGLGLLAAAAGSETGAAAGDDPEPKRMDDRDLAKHVQRFARAVHDRDRAKLFELATKLQEEIDSQPKKALFVRELLRRQSMGIDGPTWLPDDRAWYEQVTRTWPIIPGGPMSLEPWWPYNP